MFLQENIMKLEKRNIKGNDLLKEDLFYFYNSIFSEGILLIYFSNKTPSGVDYFFTGGHKMKNESIESFR